LNGQRFSRETLGAFINAFRISDEHAQQLVAQWEERDPALVVVGSLPPPAQLPDYRPRDYETLMLHEHHWLGANGLAQRHLRRTAPEPR
jgi:hypothetical protein